MYYHKMEKLTILTVIYNLLQILCLHCTSGGSSYHSIPSASIKLSQQNEKNSYDFCKHSFHSWMCQNAQKQQKYSDNFSVPTNKKKSSTLFIREAVPVYISTSIIDEGLHKISSSPSYKSSNDPVFISTIAMDKGYKKSSLSSSYKSNNDPVHVSTSVVDKGFGKIASTSLYKPAYDYVTTSTPAVDNASEKSTSHSFNPNKNRVCNHPSQSWMCQPKQKSILRGSFNSPTTIRRHEFQTSKDSSPFSIKSTKNVLPHIKYDKCSHAFHSWMCANTTKKVPTKHTTKLASKINSLKLVPKLKEKPKPQKMKDMCSHAFHSWLCQNRNGVKQNLKLKSIPHQESESIPKSTSNFPVHQILPTTQKPILLPTTSRPILLPATPKPVLLPTKHFKKDEERLPNSEKKYDKCSHAFHSWLCDKGPKKTVQQKIKSPQSIIKATFPIKSNSNIETNTVKKPVQQKLISSPSIKPTSPFKSNLNTKTNTVKYDKCSHAFHSWMCSKPKNKDIIKSPSASLIFPNTKLPSIALQPKSLKHKGTNPYSHFSQNDICSHPFHSWLCGKNMKKSGNFKFSKDLSNEKSLPTMKIDSQANVLTTSKVLKNNHQKNVCGILFNDQNCQSLYGRENKLSMFHSPVLFHFKKSFNLGSEEKLKNTPRNNLQIMKNVKPVPKLNTEKGLNFRDLNCNNPINSHLCSRNQATSKPAESFTGSSGINLATSTVVRKNQKLHQKNHCDHPFHSWNCNRANQKQRTIVNIKEIPNISDLPLEGESV